MDAGAAPRRARDGLVPAGTLRAGTPADRRRASPTRRCPASTVAMGGFYIDALPYPNEPGAIPTTNVSRDEAAQLCEAKGKRLCTELEWERACKGAGEHDVRVRRRVPRGDVRHGRLDRAGRAAADGRRIACKSAFGVREMHGGAGSGRQRVGTRAPRAISASCAAATRVAGELVGRCANAIGARRRRRRPTMGFRCCAGETNAAKVELTVPTGARSSRSSSRTPRASVARRARPRRRAARR